MTSEPDSVNRLPPRSHKLRISCKGCGHAIEEPPVQMMLRFNRYTQTTKRSDGMTMTRLLGRLRCKECGHRGARMITIRPTN